MKPGAVNWDGIIAECALIDVPAAVPATSGTFAVTGWLWWELVSCIWTLDNSAGAINALGFVEVDFGRVAAAIFPASQPVAGLATGTMVGSQGPAVDSLTSSVRPIGLGHIALPGDGRITWGFVDGDANTVVTGARLVMVGHRFANRSPG